MARLRGDYEETERFYRQSLEIKERLGDQAGMSASFYQLGVLAQIGATSRRPSASTASPSRSMSASGKSTGWRRASASSGSLPGLRGDYEEAERLYPASPPRSIGASGARPGSPRPSTNSASLAQDRGDDEEAERLYRQSLEINERLRDQGRNGGRFHQLGMLA